MHHSIALSPPHPTLGVAGTDAPPALVVLLGAESTGKSTLAGQLCAALPNAMGVEEYLREFCAARQRTPRQQEQAGIAHTQNARIEQAFQNASPPLAWVVADTCSLMTAVYSDYVFADDSLYADATAWLQQQHQERRVHLLLMGLDLPWTPCTQRDGAHAQEPVDTKLRAALHGAQLLFHTLYGAGEARLTQALHTLKPRQPSGEYDLGETAATKPDNIAEAPPRRLRARCDECLSAACEHALFSQLKKD